MIYICTTIALQGQKRCVEKENKEMKTPLHMAAENGHVE